MQEKTVFETFNDGVVGLYEQEENGNRKEKPTVTLRFQDRIVGEGQFYSAMAAEVKISRRIRVPLWKKINEDNAVFFHAVIGNSVYKIIRAQHYPNKTPPCTDLTLNHYGEKNGTM